MFTLFSLEKHPDSWARPGIRLSLLLGSGAIFLTILAIFMAFLRFAPFDQQEGMPFVLVYALVIEMLAMLSLIAYSFAKLYQSRAGSRLQRRMVWLIALLIAGPVMVISVFSVLFLDLGLESWFSSQVKTALEESQNVAESYLEEHRQSLSRDMLGIARNFDQTFQASTIATRDIERFLQVVTQTRNINQALILEILPIGQSTVVARAGFTAVLEMEPVRRKDIARASKGELVLILGKDTDQARGLIKLRGSNNLYLYAGRYVSSKVVKQTAIVNGAVRNFTVLEGQLERLKIGFVAVFALFSVLCILISVFLSIAFARSIAAPISRLTKAAQRIGQGDMAARVATENLPRDETAQLSEAFNTMAEGLQQSQSALIAANADIVRRQDYTENILRSVSTGIVGLDSHAKVLSINQRAREILECTGAPTEIDVLSVLPEIVAVVSDPCRIPRQGVWQNHTSVRLASGQSRTLLIRIVELPGDDETQLLLSIDDITELENAQRLAAWSEVAKRIAHEMRNPLTPIRLATERLRRKYLPLLKKLATETDSVTLRDTEALAQSTMTILRQVDNIALMVKEFSNFSRMPKANFAREDLNEICREATFIEHNRDHQVTVHTEVPDQTVWWACDRRQIVQVLVNLLKNAAEAISESPEHAETGEVTLNLQASADKISLGISDNGPGWPAENREKLFDPYNTMRETGSGFGLAIVLRIVHEHHGECTLRDRAGGGAMVELSFRRDTTPSEE
ncbi:MAG: HAMP domain-containing protein [Alphaproteobacteria bacterium]|nr:HAMP domain-containing protein [Alphaproteobacteria bacterium]